MAKPLLPDALWARVHPLLPLPRAKPRGGRPPVDDDRAALTGMLFVLRTGIGWEYLPQEMGCGSRMTFWRRLRDWQQASVWDRLHRVLLDELGRANKLDWTRASLDASSVRAKGGEETGRTRRTEATRHPNST
jgi:transposase